MNKADRLFVLTSPDGPVFPLDSDIVEDLEHYPGELPVDIWHWASLLTREAPETPETPDTPTA